jgi:hypothetical protein
VVLAGLAGAGFWIWRTQGEAVYRVEESLGPGGLTLAWKTGLKTPTAVRLVHQASGEVLRYELGPEPSRSHSISLPLEPEVDYRWSILGRGDRELAAGPVRRAAGAVEPEGLETGWSREGGFSIRFRTGTELAARLSGMGPEGPVEVRGPAPATSHALALPPLPPDRGYAGVRLELRSGDGSIVGMDLDPEPFRPPLARLEGFLARAARSTLAILPRLFAAGDLRVGRTGPYLEALAEDGFEKRWQAHRELAAAVLADPRLDLAGVRLPLYRRLTRLEDLDSLFIYMGEKPRFRIREAYAGLVAAEDHHDRIPDLAVRLGEAGPPWAMLPPAVTTAYTRVVFALSTTLTVPEAELRFEVDPARLAAATRAHLYLAAGNLHEGLILEARLGPDAVLSFRGDGRRRKTARAESRVEGTALDTARYPAFVSGLAFPKELLAPGANRLVLRARPLHGLPLTEVTIVDAVWLLLD